MSRPRKKHNISKAILEWLYVKEGLRLNQVARLLHVSSGVISVKLDEYGIEVRGGIGKDRHQYSYKAVGRDILWRLYIEKQLSTALIAKKLEVHQSTVSRWLRKHDIPVRNTAESLRVAKEQGRYKARKPVKDVNGYLMSFLPKHHRANHQGYVMVHILVWERWYGELVPDDMVIHHVNGNIVDNSPDNLYALTNSQHSSFHVYARKRAGTGQKSCPRHLLEGFLREWDGRYAKTRQPVQLEPIALEV